MNIVYLLTGAANSWAWYQGRICYDVPGGEKMEILSGIQQKLLLIALLVTAATAVPSKCI